MTLGRLATLPRIMLAPNGARRSKTDHPALPVTIAEIVEAARTSHAAGAGALHAHVRDMTGAHVLDAGLYGELIAEMARVVPAMPVQITTEAAGRYAPPAQRALLDRLRPEGVSVALAEMLSDGDTTAARRFYHGLAAAGVAVQHILYRPTEVQALAAEIARGTIPRAGLQCLIVLGRHSAGLVSDPADLAEFVTALAGLPEPADWAACAFGPTETACLAAAFAAGGKARVGFENSLWNADGSLARDNAERVAEIAALPGSGCKLAFRHRLRAGEVGNGENPAQVGHTPHSAG
ncbi:MAG: 3-keto-5-aminohexanoate cleavage protein [Phaeovulum sp.]|uniref:3-keto-5-aminohexanoate cleavage protein n=1 Tax=Phaeovulum sp. TaxID=2934796 RepID=UPI002734F6BE|nr:3-keto-5-aminohexanoate cleavage protein [Phaeovulum sp.]MDP3861736.1 3-keto-5-aminohexanoate cleavage protein [Phaeovulum sp.]